MNKSLKNLLITIGLLVMLGAGVFLGWDRLQCIVNKKCGPVVSNNNNDPNNSSQRPVGNLNNGTANGSGDNNTIGNHDPNANANTNTNTNANANANTNANTNTNTRSGGGGGEPSVSESTSVTSLANTVLFPAPNSRLESGKTEPVRKRTRLATEPEGEAKIIVENCQEVHVFGSRGGNSEISYNPKDASNVDRFINMYNGVLTSSSSNCTERVKKISAGEVIVTPTGTLFSLFYSPDPGPDRSKDKTLIIVAEGAVKTEHVNKDRVTPTPPLPLPPSSTPIRDERVIIVASTDVSVDGFPLNTAKPFPDKFEEIENLYNIFGMDKWLYKVLKIFDEADNNRDGNQNKFAFPLPKPVPSSASLDFDSIRLGSSSTQDFTVTTKSRTPLNLILEPPWIEIAGKRYEGEPAPDASLSYLINGGKFKVSFSAICTAFSVESIPCAIEASYFPKSAEELKDAYLIIPHNAEKKGHLVIPFTGKSKEKDEVIRDEVFIKTILQISSGALSFTPRLINTESEVQKVTLNADGPGPIRINKISLKDTDYSIKNDNCSGKILMGSGQNSSCAFDVTFNPKTSASLSGKILITADILSPDTKNSLGLKTYEKEVTGAGIKVTPLTVCFGRQKKNTQSNPVVRSQLEVQLQKPKDATIVINSVSIVTDTNSKVISKDYVPRGWDCDPTQGKTCVIRVGFSPVEVKKRTGTLLVYYNSNKEPIVIPLEGVGKPHNAICRFIRKHILGYKGGTCVPEK